MLPVLQRHRWTFVAPLTRYWKVIGNRRRLIRSFKPSRLSRYLLTLSVRSRDRKGESSRGRSALASACYNERAPSCNWVAGARPAAGARCLALCRWIACARALSRSPVSSRGTSIILRDCDSVVARAVRPSWSIDERVRGRRTDDVVAVFAGVTRSVRRRPQRARLGRGAGAEWWSANENPRVRPAISGVVRCHNAGEQTSTRRSARADAKLL